MAKRQRSREGLTAYDRPSAQHQRVLPPGCLYVLKVNGFDASFYQEYWHMAGAPLLTGDGGYPIVKTFEGLGQNEICWILR